MGRKRLTQYDKAYLAREWTNLRYKKDRTGQKLKFDDFVVKFNESRPKDLRVKQAAIYNAMREAWELGLVRAELRQQVFQSLEIDDGLSGLFEKVYGKRVRATVVVSRQGDSSDDIHRQLGAMAGQDRWRDEIDEFDTVGVGSGRGPYYTVNSFPLKDAPDVTIQSLTGAVFAETHDADSTEHPSLDADVHAAMLATRFTRPLGQLGLIRAHIAHPHDEADKLIARAGISDDVLKRNRMVCAIVGVGSLAAVGHRFSSPNSWPDRVASALAPIQGRLISVLESAAIISRSVGKQSNYYPVADICNRLFVVPPFKSNPGLDKQLRTLEETVDAVNTCLVTVSFDALRSAHLKVIVAGGADKGHALRGALERLTGRVRIFTDTAAAKVALQGA